MQRKQILARVLKRKQKIGGNYTFLRDLSNNYYSEKTVKYKAMYGLFF